MIKQMGYERKREKRRVKTISPSKFLRGWIHFSFFLTCMYNCCCCCVFLWFSQPNFQKNIHSLNGTFSFYRKGWWDYLGFIHVLILGEWMSNCPMSHAIFSSSPLWGGMVSCASRKPCITVWDVADIIVDTCQRFLRPSHNHSVIEDCWLLPEVCPQQFLFSSLQKHLFTAGISVHDELLVCKTKLRENR